METLLLLFCFKTRDEMITLFTPLPFLLTCSQSSMHSQVYITTFENGSVDIIIENGISIRNLLWWWSSVELYVFSYMHGDYAALVKDQ